MGLPTCSMERGCAYVALFTTPSQARHWSLDIFRTRNTLRRSDICAPESTHNNGVKVLIGQQHWPVRSGRQLRRRETGWGAPEANDQSINKTMLNSIRPDALASLQMSGEAKNGIRPGKGERKIRDLACWQDSEQREGNAWGDWR
jgi:hypothetical protein